MRNKLQTILFFLCCLPFMVQADETVTYLHHDVLGSVIGTSDNAGKLQKTEYLSYGTKNGVTSTESSELGYTGKPHFKDLGLSYYGSRWYDPDAGRFTGIDPVAWTKQYAVHSFNRYSYANNNPYKFVDPDGEFIFTAIAIAAVAYAAYDGYQSGGTSGALAEASGYNDAVESYNSIKAGDYSGAALAAGSIICKVCKGAKIAAKGADDILVLGRGTPKELKQHADALGGRVINNIEVSNNPKLLFKHIHSEMRKSDKIIQIMDDIPEHQVTGRGTGQWSRAEKIFIDSNENKFMQKTDRIFRDDIK